MRQLDSILQRFWQRGSKHFARAIGPSRASMISLSVSFFGSFVSW